MTSGASFENATTLCARAGRIVVLMGGESAEREVSLRSGGAVFQALQSLGCDVVALDWRAALLPDLLAMRPDRVFIALHGRGGEDGCLQGALQVAGIPYTGSGVLACALAMDKIRTKQVWQSQHLQTPDFVVADPMLSSAEIVARLGLPVMVKPAREGSSIGISLVRDAAALDAALALARTHDRQVLVEAFISGGEYTVSIVDDEVLPAIKLETPHEFYDYDAKYHATTTRYLCPAGLSAAEETEMASVARAAFEAVGAQGWGRVDFMRDAAGRVWLIEVNLVPGMTDHSLVPMAARVAGWSFADLVARILRSSFETRV
jgi:D-alanine-D-alanine ligase